MSLPHDHDDDAFPFGPPFARYTPSKLDEYQLIMEMAEQHPTILATRRQGYQCPDRSLARLQDMLRDLDPATFTDPHKAADQLTYLAGWCTMAALRAYCLAYVGDASALLFDPSSGFFSSQAQLWQVQAAQRLAGVKLPDPRDRWACGEEAA